MLIVPPEHVPVAERFHSEQPEHVSPADEHAEFVYLPLHLSLYERVEPLYEHVPFSIEHVRVQLSVPVLDEEFVTDVHNVLHVFVSIEHVHDELDTEQLP